MKYTIEGKGLRKHCIESGLNYMSVYDRMRRKYETPEEAVKNIKPRKKYNGKSVRQICKDAGVSYSSCTKLMFKGMTLDEALRRLLKMKYGKGEFIFGHSKYHVYDEKKAFIGTVDTVKEAMGLLEEGNAVNHPSHYNADPSGIECIEIVRHRNFNIGNAIKYLWRAGLKDGNKDVQDLKKAVWYIEDEIKRLEND